MEILEDGVTNKKMADAFDSHEYILKERKPVALKGNADYTV